MKPSRNKVLKRNHKNAIKRKKKVAIRNGKTMKHIKYPIKSTLVLKSKSVFIEMALESDKNELEMPEPAYFGKETPKANFETANEELMAIGKEIYKESLKLAGCPEDKLEVTTENSYKSHFTVLTSYRRTSHYVK